MDTKAYYQYLAYQTMDQWYAFASHSLSLIGKYKVTHRSLQEQKVDIDNECRRNALLCKTKGIIFHDRLKLRPMGEF